MSAILTITNAQVFGTVVNWRYTVSYTLSTRASASLSSAATSIPSTARVAANSIDWPRFAQLWRDSYKDFTRNTPAASSASEPFPTVDEHHLESLKTLITANGIEGLWPADEVVEMSRVWHFLQPWTDSAPGLASLNAMGVITATLSNGNMDLLEDLVKYGELPFTMLFSGEQFRAYKPDSKTYLGAVKELGLEPQHVAMVACHLGDLKAAKGCGLMVIYVERQDEEDWSKEEVQKAKDEGWVDLWIDLEVTMEGKKGLEELASRMEGLK
ncbi:hypothetical protein MMC25_002591 [Agyrium rufum]|nr:hypothetical protein [Agyrium rufum]